MNWQSWVPNKAPDLPLVAAISIGAPICGVVIRLALRQALGDELPFITFFPLLLLAGIWGGRGGGLGAAAISTLLAAIFLLPHDGNMPKAIWSMASFVVSGGLLALGGSVLSDTVRDLRENERRLNRTGEELRTLVKELNHRSKNGLAVIMSIVSQSARKATSAADAARIINGRLNAMASAQDELTASHTGAVKIQTLLVKTLSPFGLECFDISGNAPAAQVDSDTAPGLALLIHELATNAVKYGALSVADGRVSIQMAVDGVRAELSWVERGGPIPGEVSQSGFGTRLLVAALANCGGSASRRFEPTGIVCEISFPVVIASEHTTPAAKMSIAAKTDGRVPRLQ